MPLEIIALGLVFVVVVCLYRIVCKKYLLQNLNYTATFSIDEVYEGDRVELVEVITNDKFMSIPWVRSDFTTSKNLRFSETRSKVADRQRFVTSIFMIKGNTQIERRWKVDCDNRGYYTIDKVSLLVSDLFGWFHEIVVFPVNIDIIVLPTPFTPNDIEFTKFLPIGKLNITRHLVADPFEIVGAKEYTPRDDANRIDWQATARANKLMIRETMYSVTPAMTVVLNMQSIEGEIDAVLHTEVMEKAIQICASLFNLNMYSNSFYCNTTPSKIMLENEQDKYIKVSNAQAIDLMQILSHISLYHNRDFPTYLSEIEEAIEDIGSNSDIVIVSCYTNEKINNFVQSHENCILVLVDMLG